MDLSALEVAEQRRALERLVPVVRVVLAAAAGVLFVLAILSLSGVLTGVDLFGLRISISKPSKPLLQAIALLVVRAVLVDRSDREKRLLSVVLLLGLAIACAGESSLRRVGDGHEYIAMAVGLASGRGPGGDHQYYRDLNASLRSEPGMAHLDLWELANDTGTERREFAHFWLYAALASPFVAAARAIGGPAGLGFTALNIVLFGFTAWMLLPRIGITKVAFVLASPILWWIDKAHPEVLIVSLLAVALAAMRDHPIASLIMSALAAAQNPALVVVWAGIVAGVGFVHGFRRPAVAAGLAGSVAVLALHPAYYLASIGRVSGLAQAAVWHVPSIQRVTAPLVDLNIGVLVHFPMLSIAAVLTAFAWRQHIRSASAWISVWSGLALLLVTSQTPNVNHAGTYNPSRYGIWLIALIVPLLADQGVLRACWRGVAWKLLTIISITTTLLVARPSRPERHLDHTWAATVALTSPYGWYRPLPEIFSERTVHNELLPVLPAAYGRCEMVLLAGDQPSAWPLPCRPTAVPDFCLGPGRYCYAQRTGDDYRFHPVPPQPGFTHAYGHHTWRATTEMSWLPRSIDWDTLETVRAESTTSWIRSSEGIGPVFSLQSRTQFVAWIHTGVGRDAVWLRVEQPRAACLYDAATHELLACVALEPGSVPELPLPSAREVVLTILPRDRGLP